MSEILKTYLKTPNKTQLLGGISVPVIESKAISTVQPTTSTPSTEGESKTVSYTAIADYYYRYEDKLFDASKEKFLEVGDYHKKIIAGTAGVGYNLLLLLTVEGKVAQMAVKGAAIGLSTTSLTLGTDMNVVKAFGVSTLGFALKPSNMGYGWFSNASLDMTSKVGTSGIFARVANKTVGGWQTVGELIYKKGYHSIPTFNPLHLIPGHHSGFSVLPAQWIEAALTKSAAKNTFSFVLGKKPYEPYYTGLSALDEVYAQSNQYSLTSPVNTATVSVSNYANSRNFGVFTNPASSTRTSLIDTMDPNPNKIISKPPPKEKTEQEKLEEFITKFDSKKPKNIWFERYYRIVRPDTYAAYDRAKEELFKLKLNSKQGKIMSAVSWTVNLMFEDIAKSLKNITSGFSGASKLEAGLDYNEEIIQQLAKYKTDLEAAGGKFIIDASGNFKIETPPEKKQSTEEVGTFLKTNVPPPPKNRAEADAQFEQKQRYNTQVQGNVPAIRQLVKTANKNKQDLDFRTFINKTYNVNVMNKPLGSNLENIQKLTGKNKNLVVNQFLTRYPQYQSKQYKQAQQKEYNQHFYQD